MSKANVLSLIDALSFGLADDAPVATYYGDLMWDAVRWGIPSEAVLIPCVNGISEYVTPDVEGRLYSLFYDDVLLSMMTLRALEAVNPQWRSERGTPSAYVIEDEPVHHFTVYPAPMENSQDFVFLFGAPFGHDYPQRAVAAIIGDRRDDLPDWLDLPLALLVLDREYDRDSAHRDIDFSNACEEVGKMLLKLVIQP